MPPVTAPRRRPLRAIHHPYEGRIDPRRRRRLGEVAAGLPRTPGVYFFHGYKDRLIYVGKAKCLRERVTSYFAATALRRPPKLRRLLAEVNRLEFQECGSELEAMLLERRLIVERQPILNREHKRYAIYPYLLLTDEEFPRLTVTRHEPLPGEEPSTGGNKSCPTALYPLETPPRAGELPGLYLGPFSTPGAAFAAYHAVRALFPLRSCEGRIAPDPAGRACIYYDLGRCGGPCIGAVAAAAYRHLCDELIALLETGAAPPLDALHARMAEHAAGWRFEQAAELKQQIEALTGIAVRLQRMRRMRERNNVVIVQPAAGADSTGRFAAFLVQGGVVRRHLMATDWRGLKTALKAIYSQPAATPPFIAKSELDEMMLLDRWLRTHGTEPCCAWLNDRTSRRWADDTISGLRESHISLRKHEQ